MVARVGRDPYPFTWEIPVAVIAACGVVFCVGVQFGRAVACLLAGAGFRWPPSSGFFGSLGGVLAGDAGAGLAQPAVGVSPAVLTVAIVGAELAVFAVLGWVGWELASRWGPAVPKGMATAGEAERLLGRSRLWRSRRIVRPDLFARRRVPGKGA